MRLPGTHRQPPSTRAADLTALDMIGARTPVDGSAGYVAIERVTGTLDGKQGTFVLQHSGVMTRGARSLSVTVVPDSGTSELKGLSGRMDIKIVEGTAPLVPAG